MTDLQSSQGVISATRSHSAQRVPNSSTILQETRLNRSEMKQKADTYLRLQPSTKWKHYASPQLAGQLDRVIELVKVTGRYRPLPLETLLLNREIERMMSLVPKTPRLSHTRRSILTVRRSRKAL